MPVLLNAIVLGNGLEVFDAKQSDRQLSVVALDGFVPYDPADVLSWVCIVE